MSHTSDKVKVLKDWPRPEAGAPVPRIYTDESSFVLQYYTSEDEIAVITFPIVHVFKFGSPNDESLNGHVLYGKGLKFYSVHKVENSSWLLELERQNSMHRQHDSKLFLKNKQHYIFTFHDSTLELIATENEQRSSQVTLVASEEEAIKLFREVQNA